MRPQSAKAKGRRLQQEVRDAILGKFPELQPDDVRSTSMGASGEDLLLSPAARTRFPFYVEAKNQEALNIWKALEQAEKGAQARMRGHGTWLGSSPPDALVVFRRNHSPTYAALRFDALLDLLYQAYGREE